MRRIRKRNNFERRCYGFGPHRSHPCRGPGRVGLAGADPFTCAAAAPFWLSASKKPLSRRIILAIEGRQCVLDSFSDVFPFSDRRKQPPRAVA